MKEWFKARNIWGAAIMSLSDAEAGRLAKALWSYTMTGEQQNLSGAEKGIFAMILMTLGQDEQADADISQKRAAAGSMGGKQTQAKQANASFAINDEAKQANAAFASKKEESTTLPLSPLVPPSSPPNNPSINPPIIPPNPIPPKEERKRFAPPTVEEVRGYCQERKNSVDPQTFVDFYSSKGWKVGNQPMKDWKAAVRTWERHDRGFGRKVSAQNYTQREYQPGELDSLGDDLLAAARELRGTA